MEKRIHKKDFNKITDLSIHGLGETILMLPMIRILIKKLDSSEIIVFVGDIINKSYLN